MLGSKRHGSMGPTAASFATEAAAQAFVQQHGGRLLRYAELQPGMVDLSGGALHDTRM
ncbi:NosL [compost metagenome]